MHKQEKQTLIFLLLAGYILLSQFSHLLYPLQHPPIFFQEIQPPIANYLFQKNKISYKLQLKIKESLKSMIKNKAKIIYQIDIKSFAYYKRKAAPEA